MYTSSHDTVVSLVTRRFAEAGITVGRDIVIHDSAAYERIARDEPLQLPLTYMEGMWAEGAMTIDVMIALITKDGIPSHWIRSPSMRQLLRKLRESDQQDTEQSRRVARQHYDLSPAIDAMLETDPYKQYSCGCFYAGAQTLAEASHYKVDLTTRKLLIEMVRTHTPQVLDIGCGTGGLAEYIAEKTGAKVTGTTLSSQQLRAARARSRGCTRFVQKDYRDLSGQFDRIVSVGMFEHVGRHHHREFFEKCDSLLDPDGVILLHTIGGGGALPFYEEFTFPGGDLPTQRQIEEAIRGIFVVLDWHEFGRDYDPTMGAWDENFERAWPRISALYDEEFRRMWRFYLRQSRGLSRSGCTKLWQIQLARASIPGHVPMR